MLRRYYARKFAREIASNEKLQPQPWLQGKFASKEWNGQLEGYNSAAQKIIDWLNKGAKR